ncbi:chromatin modification-related protein eaf-1 [Fopius arisanus]|uniref:Chromatin modification-related protein eaf-1 n=1 Tax=Fopius arisanus TaxID=64838 RepID=A0A9R1TI42_9HYME|nr:PREDICTED: chromatin modification-related protein eaf-1-like [Fopius arisanus]
MRPLQILLLVLPLCAAQFRIQGPSDGNRRAQGLKYDNEKGIQYDDQRDSLGTGDFSISGASDGNSDFKIQGASDGNSDFQIHGATDGHANFHIRGPTDANAQFQIQGASDGNANFQIQGATDGNADFQIQRATDGNANFQIQGATDGHSQSSIQAPQDYNQRALSYKDSSGSRLNWKSYQHSARPQAQPQYQEPIQYAPAPAPRRKSGRRPQAQSAQAPVAPENNYKVFDSAPPAIQQLLQFQQQAPYQNIIPPQFRYDFNGPPPATLAGQSGDSPIASVPQEQPSRSQYRAKARGRPRERRAAQNHSRQRQQKIPQRIAGPPANPQPHLSTNIPATIQGILDFQAKAPYVNHIPEQWRYERLLEQEKNLPPPQYQRQPEPHPVRHSQRVRERREAQHQQAQPHYNSNLPSHLQKLLSFQASTPYTSVIPEQYSYEKLLAAQKGQHRQKRQTPRYQHNQQSQFDLSQYKRISQPQQLQQALPQYSTNIPGSLKQLLNFQSQVPYDITANKIQYRLDKPYVPQPVQAAPISQVPQHTQRSQAPRYQQPLAQAPQYQQPQRPIYQLPQSQLPSPETQRPLYQPAPLAQPQLPQGPPPYPHQPQTPTYQNPQQLGQQYQQNPQSQLIRPQLHPNQLPQFGRPYPSPYAQNNPIRPVTENQY